MEWYWRLLITVLTLAILLGCYWLLGVAIRFSVRDFAEKLGEELRRQRSAQLRRQRPKSETASPEED